MNSCKKCQSLFLDALYKELQNEEKRFFKEHIQQCEPCRSEFNKMASTLEVMNKRVRPEPGKTFWDSFEDRLTQKIEKEEATLTQSIQKQKKDSRIINFVPKYAFQIAAAFVLIVFGIFIGRMIFFQSGPEIQQASQKEPLLTQQLTGIELANRTNSYIERSKLILLALVNFDPETEDPYGLDLPFQQRISRDLVQEASLLREGLTSSNQRRLAGLIEDLEVILLQIANLESVNDFEAIELLKSGVENKGVLMQINLTKLRHSINKKKQTTTGKTPVKKSKTT